MVKVMQSVTVTVTGFDNAIRAVRVLGWLARHGAPISESFATRVAMFFIRFRAHG